MIGLIKKIIHFETEIDTDIQHFELTQNPDAETFVIKYRPKSVLCKYRISNNGLEIISNQLDVRGNTIVSIKGIKPGSYQFELTDEEHYYRRGFSVH